MGDPEPEAPQLAQGNASQPRFTQLKQPGKLDFEAKDLPQAWRRWKEEIMLYMELAMAGSDEKMKVKLFLYLIGNGGREVYDTMHSLSPPDERTFAEVLKAFDDHCNPKRNETVERYRFFMRNQDPNESLEKFVTEIKILAATCNFDKLHDSLVKDRIVCGIRDSRLREDLLKDPGLNLAKCLEVCRASELSKERNKTIEKPETAESVHIVKGNVTRNQRISGSKQGKQTKRQTSQTRRQTTSCKYCGKNHERGKEKCPAYGKKCSKCDKQNHFAAQCQSYKKRQSQIHTIQSDSDSDSDISDYDLNTVDLSPPEVNALTDDSYPKRLYATMRLGSKNIQFQLDSGATCNTIPAQSLEQCLGHINLEKTGRVLSLYDKSTVKPIGQCTVELCNPKNGKTYHTNFVVLKDSTCMPLLGNTTIQEMELVKVQYRNILTVEQKNEAKPLTKESLVEQYPEVFQGTGKMEGQYHLEIEPDSVPVVHAPRKVPVALKAQLKEELARLEKIGILTRVTEPTPWVSSMVLVRKPNGKLRICIDPKDLNKVLKRSHYPLPTIEELLPELSRARVFSTLDVKNGFWHIELDNESSRLTTFNTPFGRFRWLRLPFGLSSAPEEFQRRQHQAVEGLPGIVSIHDDILVYGEGATQEQASEDHDRKLHALMQRCREQNISLNKDKVKLRRSELPFMGHLITNQGLKPDPNKIRAMTEMPKPTDVAGVRRFIGFITYLSKFLPMLSDACEPLRKLTLKETAWWWTDIHDQAFNKLKDLVTQAPLLKYYEPQTELTLQCDASDTGLGAAITQNGQPIAYASRALSNTETRYAQIEKELLAVVFGLEKFHQYAYGRSVTVQSDHKPLEVIVKKPLQNAPKRLQRMLLRIQMYDINLIYRPGKLMQLADTLSRAYIPAEEAKPFETELETINMAQYLTITAARLDDIRTHTDNDASLQQLIHVIRSGWPYSRQEVPPLAMAYFNVRDELSEQDGIVFRGNRAVIPMTLRRDMLQRIHTAHIGIEGCLRRARECLYWPGMSGAVKDYIEKCDVCRTFERKQPKETLQSHDVPPRPWAKVGVDLFTHNSKEYLVTVDYYSGFWEVDLLDDTKSKTVIRKLKSHFARYGIPDVCVSDNGPQFSADEFTEFSKTWKFEHVTSSPGHPQSNGRAEQAVKSAKQLMKKAKKAGADAYLALLEYRNTPTQGLDSSPAQRLMSRRTKGLLPTTDKLLQPKVVENAAQKIKESKERQALYYNHGAKDLAELKQGDTVRIAPIRKGKLELEKAQVQAKVGVRSYKVLTQDGRTFRRNRRHLRKTKETFTTPHRTTINTPVAPVQQDKQRPVVQHSSAPTTVKDNSVETKAKHNSIPATVKRNSDQPTESPRRVPACSSDRGNSAPETMQKTTRSGRVVKTPSYLKDYTRS